MASDDRTEEEAIARRARILSSKEGRLSRIVKGEKLETKASKDEDKSAVTPSLSKPSKSNIDVAKTSSIPLEKLTERNDSENPINISSSTISAIATRKTATSSQENNLVSATNFPSTIFTILTAFFTFFYAVWWVRDPLCWAYWVFSEPFKSLCLSAPPNFSIVLCVSLVLSSIIQIAWLHRCKKLYIYAILSSVLGTVALFAVVLFVLSKGFTQFGQYLLPSSFFEGHLGIRLNQLDDKSSNFVTSNQDDRNNDIPQDISLDDLLRQLEEQFGSMLGEDFVNAGNDDPLYNRSHDEKNESDFTEEESFSFNKVDNL